ncbi:MAG: GNAT family N-acetyltransferase [Micrococcales bacterium]|nr:GNAT family N-acetyltransferase [Micrococcales bacterium]
MTGGVRVRVARPEDLDQAGALTAEAYHADGLLDDDGGYATELRDAGRRAREAVLLVATVPGAGGAQDVVVGTVTLAPAGTSYAEVAEPGELELRMLAVAPEARRRGVAERLTTAALREAVARRARGVVLSTLEPMVTARRLYERLGFVAAPARDWGHEGVALHVLTWTPPAAPGVMVESATWVPATVETVEGWRLGFSGGFTRRANSVLPLGRPADLGATLDAVEARYDAVGLPTVVRVCAAAPAGLEETLGSHGYAPVAATDVLVRDVEPPPPVPPHPGVRVVVSEHVDGPWLDGWLGVKAGGATADATTARQVLAATPARYLAAVGEDRRTLGVLRAAFAEDWVGLSCLVVAPEARRRGIGRLLTRAALAAAAGAGARRAFLQVEVSNAGAADLYAAEGFRPAERYAYWQR